MSEYVSTYPNGDRYWYLNDQLHREDGPAIDCASGFKAWYLNGERVTEKEHKRMTYNLYATLGKIFGLLLGTAISVALSVTVAIITLEMMGGFKLDELYEIHCR